MVFADKLLKILALPGTRQGKFVFDVAGLVPVLVGKVEQNSPGDSWSQGNAQGDFSPENALLNLLKDPLVFNILRRLQGIQADFDNGSAGGVYPELDDGIAKALFP